MTFKTMCIILLVSISMPVAAQKKGSLFLYIPSEEIMAAYFHLHSFLQDWDNDEAAMEDQTLASFFAHYVGNDTLQGLLFESFLRYTKNKNVQRTVLNFIDKNNITTTFAGSLKKLYAAVPVKKTSGGKDTIQYSYNNSEYDENINLFSFDEVGVFNGELGLLLCKNDWNELTLPNGNKQEKSFFLVCGGGTNSMTMHFTKYTGIEEQDIKTKFNPEYNGKKYNDAWRIDELPLEGILQRAGADKIFIAHGLGPDIIETIETATLNIYLYKASSKTLYEVSYFMNFSPVNIHFAERNRIFNFLFFQLLFVFLD